MFVVDLLQFSIVFRKFGKSLLVSLDLVLSLMHPLEVAILSESLFYMVQLSFHFLIRRYFLLIFTLLFD